MVRSATNRGFDDALLALYRRAIDRRLANDAAGLAETLRAIEERAGVADLPGLTDAIAAAAERWTMFADYPAVRDTILSWLCEGVMEAARARNRPTLLQLLGLED